MSHSKKRRCPLCGRKRTLLTINEAAAFVHVSRKTIYRWMRTRRLGYCVLPSGVPRIYKDSLIALPQVRKRFQAEPGRGPRTENLGVTPCGIAAPPVAGPVRVRIPAVASAR